MRGGAARVGGDFAASREFEQTHDFQELPRPMRMVPPSNHDRAPPACDGPLALRSARLPIVLALARCCFSTCVGCSAAELHRLCGRQIVVPINVSYEAAIIDQRTASNRRDWNRRCSQAHRGPVAPSRAALAQAAASRHYRRRSQRVSSVPWSDILPALGAPRTSGNTCASAWRLRSRSARA